MAVDKCPTKDIVPPNPNHSRGGDPSGWIIRQGFFLRSCRHSFIRMPRFDQLLRSGRKEEEPSVPLASVDSMAETATILSIAPRANSWFRDSRSQTRRANGCKLIMVGSWNPLGVFGNPAVGRREARRRVGEKRANEPNAPRRSTGLRLDRTKPEIATNEPNRGPGDRRFSGRAKPNSRPHPNP